MAPQTLQGADRLAAHMDALVLVPDFFKGEPLDANTFPLDTDEKKQRLQNFFATKADFQKSASVLSEVVKGAKDKFPSVGAWGAFGLCWGGKVCTTRTSSSNPLQSQTLHLEPTEVENMNST